MKATLILLLGALTSLVEAVTLTYKMSPHERACFHTTTTRGNEKIAFYFAVRFPALIQPI